jgi:hypothetical protein
MSAATVFFLFAMLVGNADSASLTTLGQFADQPSCAAAQTAVQAALKDAQGPHLFCISSNDLSGISKAAHAGE